MTGIRTVYVDAAAHAADLVARPEVAARWDEPSALPKLGVGGLAAHLARQVINVPAVLATAAPAEPPIALLDHYARVEWIDSGPDSESNTAIRDFSEREAGGGHAALAGSLAEAARGLPALLAAQRPDRVVFLPWAGWALSLDDFLITRMMEIAVHSDDVAVSVGIDPPPLPEPAFEAALDLLARLAARRHGQAALLRALTRAERAPEAINAM